MANHAQVPSNQRVVDPSLPTTRDATVRVLSQTMGSADNWAIFKGYHALNVLNLLHLQTQMDELSQKHERDDPGFSMEELDEALHKYNRSLAAYAKVCKLLEPGEKDVVSILRYSRVKLGNHPEIVGKFAKSEVTTNKVTRAVLGILSACLLLVPMVILYFVKDGFKPLIIIAVWTIAFSATTSLLTEAKYSEILVAAATYAAVMVVFISGEGVQKEA
ncbi:hypothetical protein QBC36DRAFT_352055 [Triangularia setosa]|uniref:DUF6594 domain-containing protein n=1 Tax=Triangularia setosa TaxID=2587417 RepID=A0AAN6W8V9_9PEZI|nr:hypothetical protein QBC36DRAFT_352055 [Podospora setosa]